MDKKIILQKLNEQIASSGHIIGASVGSGITAKFAALGGADILLALSAGKYRIMGRSSFSSYFCYGNNNEQVMVLGKNEIFPIVRDVPLLFGLMATDPTINLYDYLKEIKASGFSGIVNFPTVSLIDGKFREALEEDGVTYDKEIAAIKLANHLGMFTMAFVTNVEETQRMLEAGADVICVHLGLTRGGFLGAKKYISIGEARKVIDKIFDVCKKIKPEVLRMIYAGPANTLTDMRYIYQYTASHGYIGGSTFDRIPIESAVMDMVQAFKQNTNPAPLNHRPSRIADIVEYARQYVEDHYQEKISFNELAHEVHISHSYLSVKFKKDVGVTFTEYLMSFRFNKAKELLETERDITCKEVGLRVGYTDIAQFGKSFKKYVGKTLTDYRKDYWASKK